MVAKNKRWNSVNLVLFLQSANTGCVFAFLIRGLIGFTPNRQSVTRKTEPLYSNFGLHFLDNLWFLHLFYSLLKMICCYMQHLGLMLFIKKATRVYCSKKNEKEFTVRVEWVYATSTFSLLKLVILHDTVGLPNSCFIHIRLLKHTMTKRIRNTKKNSYKYHFKIHEQTVSSIL